MFYGINYKNGSMGNTILAHALYACSKARFDLLELFSIEGHAHKISTVNQSKLIAWHQDTVYRADVIPILHVTCTDWDEVLRIKLSYSKWYLDFPTKNNFLKFGFTDPLDDNWLENLTIKYYDMIRQAADTSLTPELKLSDYISGNIDSLQIAVEKLGWTWDHAKSNEFFNIMQLHNNRYFNWLDTIKTIVSDCVNAVSFETNLNFWEQALVTAKVCEIENIHPSSLHWDGNGCFLDTNSVSLIESLERIKNGKTI